MSKHVDVTPGCFAPLSSSRRACLASAQQRFRLIGHAINSASSRGGHAARQHSRWTPRHREHARLHSLASTSCCSSFLKDTEKKKSWQREESKKRRERGGACAARARTRRTFRLGWLRLLGGTLGLGPGWGRRLVVTVSGKQREWVGHRSAEKVK